MMVVSFAKRKAIGKKRSLWVPNSQRRLWRPAMAAGHAWGFLEKTYQMYGMHNTIGTLPQPHKVK